MEGAAGACHHRAQREANSAVARRRGSRRAARQLVAGSSQRRHHHEIRGDVFVGDVLVLVLNMSWCFFFTCIFVFVFGGHIFVTCICVLGNLIYTSECFVFGAI
uniref:Uncharacterized protein n=1 Tax=Oryza meridionalis TaxID=40149 RepID=A0A0E0E7Y7_9ORYZ